MDIRIFPRNELAVALGAVRAVDAKPTRDQDRFLEVVARLHGVSLEPCLLPRPTPEETARMIADPHRRKRLLQLAIVMAMIDGHVLPAPAARVAELSRALGVEERSLHTLLEISEEHRLLARLDLTRRMVGRFVGEAWQDEKFDGVRKFLAPLAGRGADAEVARRYQELGLLPEGTFGRTYWEHCRSRQFAFPGEAGGIPERGVFHDLGHVLAGYDTDPAGEIQQAAFQSGFVRNDGFVFLFFGIVQFHLGIKVTPVAEAEVDFLDIERFMIALARGAACKVDLSDHWDCWPYFPRPLEDVRRELGIPPLAA